MFSISNNCFGLKVRSPIFQKFSVSFEESSLQRCKFEILVETVKPFGYKVILYIAVAYIVLCKFIRLL